MSKKPSVGLKVLKESGYQNAIIGKWHLKKEPSGFDYYNILHDQGRYWDPILRTTENFQKNVPPQKIMFLAITFLKHIIFERKCH